MVLEREFISLIKQHERIILKICDVYCKEVEDREDLYQDIIVQLWKSFPKFNSQSKVTTWFYRIALNTAISRYRNVKRRPVTTSIDRQTSFVTNQDNGSKRENLKLLYRAIESLNKVEKAIVMLYMEEAKYKEIADILGISVSNVGFKVNRIKKKLNKELKSMGYEY